MAAVPVEKDRITCHVLDTTIGRPGKGIRVKLELLAAAPPAPLGEAAAAPNGTITTATAGATAAAGLETLLPSPPLHHGASVASKVFESQTDEDGRVHAWLPYSSATSSGEVPLYTLEDVLGGVRGPSRWALKFDTAAYFGEDKTFFPEVVVVFKVDEGQHYHVPLLLAPYSYSTYRGS